MKKKFIPYLLFLFFTSAFGQSPYVDSLLKVADRQPDSVKVQTLYAVCAHYQDSEPDSALMYCDRLYKLATEMRSARWQANALNEKGYVKLVFHDYPPAMEYFREAARLFESINNKKGAGNAYLNLGMCYSDIGEYAESIRYNELALKYYNETNFYGAKGNAFNNIALIYMRQHAYEKALVYLDSATACYKNAGLDRQLGNPLMNRALIESEKGNYDKAIEIYQEALPYFLKNNDKLKIGGIYNNIGNIYTNTGRHERALIWLQKAIDIAYQLNDTVGLASSYLNISTSYRMNKQASKMRTYLDTARFFVSRLTLPEIEVYYYEELFRYYVLVNKADSAQHFFERYKMVKDSLIKSDITRQLSDMSVKYDTEQVQRDADQKKKQYEQERLIKNGFIIFSVFVVVLLVILFFALKKVKAYNVLINNQREDLIRTNREVTRQKTIIEQKQKEILDSIHYARRIQHSLMPHEKYILRILQKLKK